MAEIRIWAPLADAVEVRSVNARESMKPAEGGWWALTSVRIMHGTDYALWVDGEGPVPDPRSGWQPEGVSGPSRRINHSRFEWNDEGWKAPPLREGVIYELHIGTFTPEGTFASAIERLDYLRELGVTHVELMPVAEFAGTRGWGYDGVNLYAPHHAYGGPEALKEFVQACHRRGLATILDVVYNHLGPVGNYLPRFGPYFTDHYLTPWGDAVNFDGPGSDEVRRYFIDNALMWLRDYHFDGLRIDAVHAFFDRSAMPFLEQLTCEVQALSEELDRRLDVIAESDLNDPRVVRPVERGGMGAHAQWNEDFHHSLHTLLTGENFGYYRDFGKVADLATVLCAGFAYDGRYSVYRERRHGRSAADINGDHFIACMQNHDQVGNRGAGERIGHLVSPDRVKVGAAITLLSPFVPMLFQGEEWSASSPFFYFTDFDDPRLAEAVKSGRQAEFEDFGWSHENIADPQAESTFRRSQLDWSERDASIHKEMFEWYRALIQLRRREPDFSPGPLDRDGVVFDDSACWLRFRRGRYRVICNFSGQQRKIPIGQRVSGKVVLASASDVKVSKRDIHLPPHSVAVVVTAERA